MEKKNYSLEIPKQQQRIVQLPIFENTAVSTKNKEANSQIIFSEKDKTVDLGNGERYSLVSFLTRS